MALDIGFVGTGGIAKAHFDALGKIPEARVVACMDVDADRAAEAAARFAGAGAYTDLAEMLDAHDLGAAYVCVPPHAHGEIELALVERGIPFLVEKPIGIDRETPQRILEALEGKELVTSVAYMMRYRENATRLRDHLGEDEPVVARGGWIGGMPGVHWWRRKDQSGGQIVEQTTHVFDLVRYLFGEVKSVFCAGRTGLITDVEGHSVEDASICTLVFESGLLCELTSSCAVGMGEVALEVFTRKGRAKLDGTKLDLTLSHGDQTHTYRSVENPFLLENQAFVRARVDGDASGIRSPYADAVKTQMVTCAANESMQTGAAVQL
ncbi:MAG: Gfo/Idh/MocA family protein [Planctomycetota bacterium]|jgi:predicted dehydrogenase